MATLKRVGFTLIEVLISVVIGTLLVASIWTLLNQIMQAAKRNQALTTLHLEASAIHMALNNAISSMFHGGQFRIEYIPQALPGKPDSQIVIDFTGSTTKNYYNDLVWYRLSFRTGSDGLGTPKLSLAMSEDQWEISGTPPATMTGVTWDTIAPSGRKVVHWGADEEPVPVSAPNRSFRMRVSPEMRRDRRRDINDNDQRLLRNIPPTLYSSIKETMGDPKGDGDRLQRRLVPLSTHISRFRMEIVDFRGYRTVINPNPGAFVSPEPPLGISYYDAADNAVVPPSPPSPLPSGYTFGIWSSTVRVLDGIWSDGRNAPCSMDGISPSFFTDYDGKRLPTPALERPALIRVCFELNLPQTSRPTPQNLGTNDGIEFDKKRPNGNNYISREFSFTFSTSPLRATK